MFARRDGVPVSGGLAVAAAFALFGKAGWGILASSLLMLTFGLIDDRREMSVAGKLLSQILCACLLVYSGAATRIMHIGGFLNIAVTFLWLLGISNAFNHLDIMDGLAGLAAALISASFFVISALNGDVESAVLCLALCGASAGFLTMNLPPAKIYMGNSGSHFLGFVLAYAAISASRAPAERKVALLAPILILGFPIFDTAFLVWTRAKHGRSVFKKSDDHTAFLFLKAGYSKRRALAYMGSLCVFFCLSGIAVSRASNLLGGVISGCVILTGLAAAFRLKKWHEKGL